MTKPAPLEFFVMPLSLPDKCLRDRSDCEPLAQIASDNGKSFICCGLNDQETRSYPHDEFRHCWKNQVIDERTDWDRRDITDTISVLAQALSIKANMEQEEHIAGVW
jgi:hypothetical protein